MWYNIDTKKREVNTMTRTEIKNTAIETLGFEHPMTIRIFAIDEVCKDDEIALTLMQTALIEGINYAEEE
jgi:hypothetical protein